MTPSSFEWPAKPLRIDHPACGASWDLYTPVWPPTIVVCTGCQRVLKLIAHDPHTHRTAYRQI